MAERHYSMSAEQRDAEIVRLRRKGVPMHKIARHVGMSASGVCRALERIAQGRSGVNRRDY